MKKVVPENAVLIPDGAKKVFEGVIFDVYHWQQEMFDGSLETFEMIGGTDILKIFAIVDDKLVVLREEQPSIGTFRDIPGGGHDHTGESHLEAAQRELKEETGMVFSYWKLIRVAQPYNKFERFVYFYLATGLQETGDIKLDAGERIKLETIDFEEYLELGSSGKIRTWPSVPVGVKNLDELLATPEFKGKEIER